MAIYTEGRLLDLSLCSCGILSFGGELVWKGLMCRVLDVGKAVGS